MGQAFSLRADFEVLAKPVLKYRPGYPQDGFKTIEDAREWVLNFVNWYNNKHYHSGLNFLTPNSRHNGQDDKIMKKRKKVYESARKLNPQTTALSRIEYLDYKI